MATKITVTLEDDLDGGPAEETVRFGLGGAQYEIDLNTKNARAFRTQLAPFIEHARQAEDNGAGRRGPHHAVSAAATSGPGRKPRASRSAPAGASPPAWSSGTTPPPKDPDPRAGHGQRQPAHSWPLTASQRRGAGPLPAAHTCHGRAFLAAVDAGDHYGSPPP